MEIRQRALTITLISVASAIYSQILNRVHNALLNTLYHSSPPKAIRRIKRKRSARERESGAATRRMCMWNDLEPLWNAEKNSRLRKLNRESARARLALCMWNDLDPLWDAEKNSRLRKLNRESACARSERTRFILIIAYKSWKRLTLHYKAERESGAATRRMCMCYNIDPKSIKILLFIFIFKPINLICLNIHAIK